MLPLLEMAENAGRPTSIRKAAIYPNLSSPTGYRFKKINNVAAYEGAEAGVWKEQAAPYQPGENVPSPEQVEQFRRESPDYARKLEDEAKRVAEVEARPPELGFASPIEGGIQRGFALNTHPQNEGAINQINAARRRIEEARKRVASHQPNTNEAPLGGLGGAGAAAAGAAAAGAPSVFRPTLASMAQRGENVNEFESEWARYAEKKGNNKGGRRRKARKTRRSKRKQRRAASRRSRK